MISKTSLYCIGSFSLSWRRRHGWSWRRDGWSRSWDENWGLSGSLGWSIGRNWSEIKASGGNFIEKRSWCWR
jgi:hypothetical protein